MSFTPWQAPAEATPSAKPVDEDDVVPLLDIWYRPAATARFLVARHPGHLVLPLAIVTGVVQLQIDSLDPLVLLIGLVLSAIYGVFALVLHAGASTLLGRMFGGTGRFVECATALAWGSLPFAALKALGLIGLVMMQTMPDWLPVIGLVVLAIGALAQLVGVIWETITLAEAHRFGYLESFATVIGPRLVLVVLALCLIALSGLALA